MNKHIIKQSKQWHLSLQPYPYHNPFTAPQSGLNRWKNHIIIYDYDSSSTYYYHSYSSADSKCRVCVFLIRHLEVDMGLWQLQYFQDYDGEEFSSELFFSSHFFLFCVLSQQALLLVIFNLIILMKNNYIWYL